MNNVIVPLCKKEFMELYRTPKLLIMVVSCAFFGIVSPLSAYYMPTILKMVGESQNVVISIGQVTYRDAMEQYIKNFTQIGTIIVIFLLMGEISGDKKQGTFPYLLSKPISPYHIMIAKLFMVILLSLAGTLSALLCTGFYTWYLFPNFPIFLFLRANILLFCYIFGIGSITLGLSAMMKVPIISGICAVVVWIGGALLGSLGIAKRFMLNQLAVEMNQVIEGFPIQWEPLVGTGIAVLIFLGVGTWIFSVWEVQD